MRSLRPSFALAAFAALAAAAPMRANEDLGFPGDRKRSVAKSRADTSDRGLTPDDELRLRLAQERRSRRAARRAKGFVGGSAEGVAAQVEGEGSRETVK